MRHKTTPVQRANAQRHAEAVDALARAERHSLALEYDGDRWRFRNDLPVNFALTLAAELALTDADDVPPIALAQ